VGSHGVAHGVPGTTVIWWGSGPRKRGVCFTGPGGASPQATIPAACHGMPPNAHDCGTPVRCSPLRERVARMRRGRPAASPLSQEDHAAVRYQLWNAAGRVAMGLGTALYLAGLELCGWAGDFDARADRYRPR
jgi:hypothetical protein